jgi:O-antigen ligase
MEFLTVLFAIAGLVWLIPVVQNGRLIVIAMAVLGVGTVFGPDFFHIDGPIQLSLDRLLWFGMFAMAMVGWRMGYVQIPKLHRIDWIVVGIVGWTLISAISSEHQTSGTPPTARWLFYILMPSGMYAIARAIKIETRDVRWMLGGAIGLGLYLAVTAVLEIYGVQQLVFPRFIADAESWQFYGRGRGPLMNPSGNGILMSVALVATSIGVIFSRGRGKMVYAVVTLIVLAGLYATLTRSAWMGGIAAIGLIAFIHSQRWQRVLVVAMVLLLGGASVAGLKDQLVRMKRDKNLTAEDAEKSMKLRPLLAIVSWEMFKDHPIAGHGYGHYFAHNDAYHNDRGYNMPLEQARTYAQHNVFLSLLVDTGLIGFSLFSTWLLMLGGIGWQLARDLQGRPESRWIGLLMLGTLIAYFCNGMFQDVMIIPMVHMFLFFLAGVTVTAFHKGLAAALPRESPSRVVATVTACPDLA